MVILIRPRTLSTDAGCLVFVLVTENLFADHFRVLFLTAAVLSVFLMMICWKLMAGGDCLACCPFCGGYFFEDPDGSLICDCCCYSIRADGSPDTSYMDDDDIEELIGADIKKPRP